MTRADIQWQWHASHSPCRCVPHGWYPHNLQATAERLTPRDDVTARYFQCHISRLTQFIVSAGATSYNCVQVFWSMAGSTLINEEAWGC